jgi:hypothetical protein
MKSTIKFLGIIAAVAIIVLSMAGCASMNVVSVEWETLEGPAKARQYIGISTSEVKVYANYESGDHKQASAGSLSYDRNSVGVQTVTVNLGGTSGSFQTEVMELTGIRVVNPPTKTTYNVGESLDVKGIKVMGSWRDLPDAEIATHQMLLATQSGFDSNTAGNKVVTLTWNRKTATFNVTVVQPPR